MSNFYRFHIWVITAGTFLVVLGSLSAGLFSGIESQLEDRLFTERKPAENIILLAIDNESIRELGQWPWPREIFARVIERLGETPPRALGIDVMFAEPSRFGAEDDGRLRLAVQNAPFPIVFPKEAESLSLAKDQIPRSKRLLTVLPALAEDRAQGIVNIIPDKDGVVRRFPTAVSAGDIIHESFAAALLNEAGVLPPVYEQPTERIAYAARPGSFRWFSVSALLSGGFDRSVLGGAFVLIGATAPDLHDTYATPVSRGIQMAGVEIQANILDMMQGGIRLRTVAFPVMALVAALGVGAPLLFFLLFRASATPLVASALFGILYNTALFLFIDRGIVPNMLHANAAWLLSAAALVGGKYAAGEREKEIIKKLFSRYVAADVLRELLRNPAQVELGGKEVEVTVLFSDIRGFTSLSEKLEPTALVRLLNRYFEAMTAPILEQRGVLDKYIGDAIMAFWGAPLADAMQADHAVRAALDMKKALAKLNEDFRAEGIPEIATGIGIYTGKAVVGNVGSSARFDYTVIGDTVNAASRLEGQTKEFGVPIIIGEQTKKQLTENYTLKKLGSVKVKGKEEMLDIYSVLES